MRTRNAKTGKVTVGSYFRRTEQQAMDLLAVLKAHQGRTPSDEGGTL